MATIPQDPVTMLILSLPPTSLLPRAAVTITSGPHHLGSPRHPHRGRPFSLITRSPSPEFRPSLPPEGPITPTAFPGPLSACPYTFPETSLRLLQGSPTGAPRNPGPQRAPRQGQRGPSEEGAEPRPRSLFMNGGAGGAMPHYYASRRALRPGATHPLAGRAADVTEPGAGGGAGRGDSRCCSRGRGGFSGSAQTLRCPDPSRASPRPSRTRSREVSSGPRRRHQASGRARRMLGRGAGGQAPSGRQRSEVEIRNPESG